MNIDGKKFKSMIDGAVKALEANRDFVDSLNVFPIPDGDTGTNMFFTIVSANKGIIKCSDRLSDIAATFSKEALRGAHGNSGVILSQIFKGLADEFETENFITPKVFSKGLLKAVEVAYSNTPKPKEGTILTVIKGMAEASVSIAKKRGVTCGEFLEQVIEEGKAVLDKTPTMLPILAKAGVVDAGGRGLIVIFEGMLFALTGKQFTTHEDVGKKVNVIGKLAKEEDILENDYDNITFQYCTEYFIVHLNNNVTSNDIERYKEYLMTIGDCVLVIANPNLIKTHVHTNTPDQAMKAALELGELDDIKIENMMQQHRRIVAKYEQEPDEPKENAIIAICPGDGFEKIFKELGVTYTISGGQTFNPSVNSMLAGIKKVNAKNVYILPNNGNVVLAANQAKGLVNSNVIVIPTKSPTEGISAMLGYDQEKEPIENEKNMLASFEGMKTIEITKAVRDVRMNHMSVKIGDYIAVSGKTLIAKGDDVNEVAFQSIKKIFDDDCMISIYFGKEMSKEEGQALSERLASEFEDAELSILSGGQSYYHYIISIE